MAGALLLGLIAGVATARFWAPFPIHGHSLLFDYFRQLAFDASVRQGLLYPRWLADTYYGYGSPLFHFYAPLAYYVNEIPLLLGASVATALKLGMVAGLAASALAMYLWCLDHARPSVAFLAGLVYLLAPYRLVDVLVRHALGENLAFVFIPLAAWGLSGPGGGARPFRRTVAALAVALLVLSHNIMALLSIAALALWWLVLWGRQRDARAAASGAVALALGLLLSLFFWLPALAERSLVQSQESLTEGYMYFANHFVYPAQLVVPSWGYGSSDVGPADTMSFQLGLLHWLLVVLALVAWLLARRRRQALPPVLPYGLLLVALALACTLPLSAPLYERLPLLRYVQFPWRFLGLAVLGASALAVALEPLYTLWRLPVRPLAVTTGLALAAIALYAAYAEPRFAIYDRVAEDFVAGPLTQVQAWSRDARYSDLDRLGGLAYLRSQGQAGTESDDFMPVAVRREPRRETTAVAVWMGPGVADVDWRRLGPTGVEARVVAPADGSIEFAHFNYPGWSATVNGRPVVLGTKERTGTIVVPVPAGASVVRLRFGSTPLRSAAGVVSLLALVALALYAFDRPGRVLARA